MINQAWRDSKILVLVTFDVKKTFNNAALEVLTLHFCQKEVLEQSICLIKKFGYNQKA